MIQLPNANKPVRLEELPKLKVWPMPGIAYLCVAGLLVAMVSLGASTSGRMLSWIGTKLQSGMIGDWARPVQLIFAGWTALIMVVALLLTITESFGGVEREEALWDNRAWLEYSRNRKAIDAGPLAGEVKMAYTQVDHPDMAAPAFFERFFMLMLTVFQILALLLVVQLHREDPYPAARGWLWFAAGTSALVLMSLLRCGVTRVFAGLVALWTPIVFRVAAGIDPAGQGAAWGWPPYALSLAAGGTTVLVGLWVALRGRPHWLLFVTAAGLRKVKLDRGQASLDGRVDQPFVMAATPAAIGCRVRVARKDGRSRLPAMLIPGEGITGRIAEMLVRADGRADREGSDETSGIAGRLGELNLIAWSMLVLLPVISYLTLVPPLVQHLRVKSLLEAYHDDWVQGRPEPLETGLAQVVANDPSFGPAVVTRARLLWEMGRTAEAEAALASVIAAREPWPDAAIVGLARRLLTVIQANPVPREEQRGPGGVLMPVSAPTAGAASAPASGS